MTEAAVEDALEEAASAPYHTILEIWRGVLAPAESELDARITPQWANRIISTYQGVRFKDMGAFRASYFFKVLELAAILDSEIDEDPECLNATDPEEDRTLNGLRYLTVLIAWQKQFLLWELLWDWSDESAAVETAAMSEVHKMFFGEQGILGLLDQIKFEFTDEHRGLLVEILEETRREVEDAR